MNKTLEVITLPVGQYRTNCYIVIDKISSSALIIDPGDDPDYIERVISDNRLKPTQILVTHGHFDHILAVFELKLVYDIPFKIHKRDKFLVGSMRSGAKHFLGITVDPPPMIDEYINDEEILKVGESFFQIIETPGHTPGSVCLYFDKEGFLFTGDLIFAQGAVGRTDFSYSNKEDLKKSLAKIFDLPSATIIYPGHGSKSTLTAEKFSVLKY